MEKRPQVFFFETSPVSLPTNEQFSTWCDESGLEEVLISHTRTLCEQEKFHKAPKDGRGWSPVVSHQRNQVQNVPK